MNRVDQPTDLNEAKEQAAELKRTLHSLEDKIEQLESDPDPQPQSEEAAPQDAVDALRSDCMMAHLLDSLEAGKDIGHYGRLVFAMVARHFMEDEELFGWLTRDSDFSEESARALIRQVESRDYNPPRRDRIVGWQSEQDFPIIPNPDDPDCGNVYRSLKFPDRIYDHIQEYQEEKAQAES